MLLPLLSACSLPVESNDQQVPLALDPGVLSGELENGFKYYLRSANGAAENDRLELRLVVKAGSLHERSDQRGYAHLIEHLVYRGTRSFPSARIESLISDNGLRWGEDVNATTHYGATVYRFSLHQSDQHLMPELLALMSEWLGDVRFNETALEQEKRIVNAELRERYAARNFVVDPVTVSAYAGTRYDNKQPAGHDVTINAATPEALRQFWQTHYRPDNAALIITGTDKPWQFEGLIDSVFSSLEGQLSQVKTTGTEVTEYRTDSGVSFYQNDMLLELLTSHDPTLALPQLSVNVISKIQDPPSDIPDSIEAIKSRFRSQLLFNAFSYLVRDRIVNTQACNAIELGTSLLESGQSLERIALTLKPESVLHCLSVAFNAVSAIQKATLTSEEYDGFDSLFNQIVTASVNHYRNRDAALLASGLVDMVTNGEVLFSAWDLHRILNDELALMDLEKLNSMLRDIADSHKLVFSVVSNKKKQLSITEMVVAIGQQNTRLQARSRSTVVRGSLRQNQKRLPATDTRRSEVGVRAKVSLNKNREISVLQAPVSRAKKIYSDGLLHEWRLENGATVILIQDQEFDEIAMTVISNSGYAGQTGSAYLAARNLPEYIALNGVGGYTGENLRSLMRSKKIEVQPFVEPLHHGLKARGTVAELSPMLALVQVYFKELLVLEPQSYSFIDLLSNRKPEADLQQRIWQGATFEVSHDALKPHSFIDAHRQLFGSTDKFGFIFVGAVEPEELERELEYLIVHGKKDKSATQYTTGNLLDYYTNGNDIADINLVLSCAAEQFELTPEKSIHSTVSWQLLTDILNERLRYSLREGPGLVYEIDSNLPPATDLVQQIRLSVLPEDLQQVKSIVSAELQRMGLEGVSQAEFKSATARFKRERKLTSANYESLASDYARQWLHNGKVSVDSTIPANPDQLNGLAQCLAAPFYDQSLSF